jgi:hypothetical protein
MFASEVKADVLHLSPNVADAPLADMLRVDVGIDSGETDRFSEHEPDATHNLAWLGQDGQGQACRRVAKITL